jgi:riboflavin kinase/FMN adenylyltransferase
MHALSECPTGRPIKPIRHDFIDAPSFRFVFTHDPPEQHWMSSAPPAPADSAPLPPRSESHYGAVDAFASTPALLMTTRTVLTIGNFDGLHLGHQALLAACTRDAQDEGLAPVAMTFEPHPSTWFAQREPSTFRLMLPTEKEAQLRAFGVEPLVLPFNAALAAMPARTFVEQYLVERLRISRLHIGEGFVFGARRQGTTHHLQQWGPDLGFETVLHTPTRCALGEVISSTRLRARLQEGDMEGYRSLSGQWWRMDGVRESGAKRGRTIGVPTINLYPHERLLPPFGVYATRIATPDRVWDAITNLGLRPTFSDDDHRVSVETLCLDGSPNVDAGTSVRVQFLKYLRSEQAFPSAEALRAQITLDVDAARTAHAQSPSDGLFGTTSAPTVLPDRK